MIKSGSKRIAGSFGHLGNGRAGVGSERERGVSRAATIISRTPAARCRGWSTTHPELLPELKARGKTVLVISHDDRFYEVGDSIVKLDYGKIVYDQPVVPALAETSVQFSSKAVAS